MYDKADIAISSKKFEGFSLKERESDKPLKNVDVHLRFAILTGNICQHLQ